MFKVKASFTEKIPSAWFVALMTLAVCLGLGAPARAQVPPVQIKDRDDLSGIEVATMLGVHIWKFDVVLPANASGVTVSLQQRDKNGGSQGLTSMTGPDGAFALVGGFQNGQVTAPISTEADGVIALQIIPTVPQ